MSRCIALLVILLLSLAILPSTLSFHASPLCNSRHVRAPMDLRMGNNAAFGIFSPAVYAAKLVLGEVKLNKVMHAT